MYENLKTFSSIPAVMETGRAGGESIGLDLPGFEATGEIYMLGQDGVSLQ